MFLMDCRRNALFGPLGLCVLNSEAALRLIQHRLVFKTKTTPQIAVFISLKKNKQKKSCPFQRSPFIWLKTLPSLIPFHPLFTLSEGQGGGETDISFRVPGLLPPSLLSSLKPHLKKRLYYGNIIYECESFPDKVQQECEADFHCKPSGPGFPQRVRRRESPAGDLTLPCPGRRRLAQVSLKTDRKKINSSGSSRIRSRVDRKSVV